MLLDTNIMTSKTLVHIWGGGGGGGMYGCDA